MSPSLDDAMQRSRRLLHRRALVAGVASAVPVPGLDRRIIPLKDHHLLARAEQHSGDIDARLNFLADAVRRMGDVAAGRLGLSRPYVANGQPGRCWLMADGFFSLDDPQE